MAENLRKRRGGGGGSGLSAPLLQDLDDGSDSGSYERLAEEQGPHDRDSSGGHLLDDIVNALVAGWGFVIASVTQCLVGHGSLGSRVQVSLSPAQEEQLDTLRKRIAKPFDITCKEHQDGLLHLWKLGYPGEKLTGLKSAQWKEMGWQGSDPSTDFRGAGYLALENLIYFAETYPSTFHDLMRKVNGDRSEWEYPFCVAGVNLTFSLIDILDLHAPDRLPNSDAGKQFLLANDEYGIAFQEIYCVGMELLDVAWLEMRASYMDFSAVMKSVKEKMTVAIANARSLSMIRLMLLGEDY
eukprot:CAMPEP_0177773060 /NCGR_PEP_ID=MMETSP0491_2-20121128/12613_1 /TAXON_ID=63592 /ORGANISM="Tetraselmis chuii, Strain PLY429" /LENGTH=296 /DNA_ID=CAMNT_0019291029 /DNA_START=113 /DNA_END=1003 /DNA_ORIENTATION=-